MEQHAEQWDLIIKVKHGDTLRRIGAHVHGKLMDHNMTKLRAKICSLFKFSHDTDLILKYTDIDGDIITLDNDDELFDAVISQRLNPLRITVELKSKPDTSSAESPQCETTPITNVQSEPVMDPLLTVLSNLFNVADKAISNSPASEVIKSEPFKSMLNNIHKDVKKATSFSPALSNLINELSKVVNQTEPVCESSSSTLPTSAVTTNPLDLNVPYESKPWDFPTQITNEIVDSVKKQSDPALTADAARPLYPLEELLITAAQKYPENCEDKGSGSSDVHGKNTDPVHTPYVSEQSNGYVPTYPSYTIAESDNKNTLTGTQISFESPNHPNTSVNREDVALLSSMHSYQRPHFNEESFSHMGVQCDGCGMLPIKGPRFKSKVMEDYDLCNVCYNQTSSRKGRKLDYMKLDPPRIAPKLFFKGRHNHHPRPHFPSRNLLRGCHVVRPQWNKLESQFIKDVTVLDGTVMSPLTPFTKIWRLCNSGTTTWPFGTQLVWVDGDQLGQRTSASLEIPVTGFPSGRELDIAVDFTAPSRPGSYISYWCLQSPNMQKFGQRVWVHIQVEDSRPASVHNLNLPAENNTQNASGSAAVNTEVSIDINDNSTEIKDMENIVSDTNGKESNGSVPIRSVEQQNLIDITDNEELAKSAQSSSYTLIDPSLALDALANNNNNNSNNDIYANVEETLLNELQEMGFKQIDLNKEVLSRNSYDLEQSIEDLCDFAEWDPLLSELHEMGFEDRLLNKKMLVKNGGSIKRAVLDLIAGKNE